MYNTSGLRKQTSKLKLKEFIITVNIANGYMWSIYINYL